MWSYPSYDPNLIADPDYDAAFAALTELQADPRDPLLANAYQQRYMPGSVFKVFTTSVALDDGVVTSTASSPTRASTCRRRPPTRSRTTTDRRAAATSRRCSRGAATRRSRASPSISGRSASSPERSDGASVSRSRSTSPAGGQHHRRHVEPRREPATPRDPGLRPERGSSSCRSTWRWPPPRSPTAA